MSGSDQIWAEALRTLERGQSFALATVVNVRGSTPREVGAKMIVREDGQFGTIGGGCGEAEVFRKARVLLEEKNDRSARLAEVDLTGDFDQREIGTCGGIMDVFVDLWSPARDLEIARKLADFAGRSAPGALLTVIDSGARAELLAGSRTFIDPRDSSARDAGPIDLPAAGFAQIVDRTTDAIPTLLELDGAGGMQPVSHLEPNGGVRLFVDPIVGAQRLIIVGAGHIAVPLCALGAMLGFHVTVIDDRASFANRDRFPQADDIIVKPFTDAIDSLALDAHCYLVSVTRGHSFDEEVVRAALMQPCGFVGMIGSRRRVKATLERIGASGVPKDRLADVHAPLGVAIGGETPEEIAISIIAEIIRERRTDERDEFTLGVRFGNLKRSK
ncbi:XdhC family protein [Candidatus Binatus sp.]|uniref:XdhC family protein n=1 Tax=Candidatus Binatus sp. TaxID=2811406 RepID=UPI003BB12BE0